MTSLYGYVETSLYGYVDGYVATIFVLKYRTFKWKYVDNIYKKYLSKLPNIVISTHQNKSNSVPENRINQYQLPDMGENATLMS